jgi:LmbE family N-acetylglucosaminyl deacetylase
MLSIGAHPADVFDQCGGTMVHHAARGDYIACLVLTTGARVHDKVISDQMQHEETIPEGPELLRMMAERTGVKQDEVRAAARILGVKDVCFLDADDDILLVTKDLARRAARVIRQIRPDVILTHFPWEGDGLANPHAVAGQIVMHAVQFANAVDPGDRNPPHRLAQVFFFGEGAADLRRHIWSGRGGYHNDVFVDTTDVIETKLAAIDCLVSQGYAGKYARKRLETSDGAFGGGYSSYGEGFIRMRSESHYHLPVPERNLEIARLSDHELMERYSWRLPAD